MSQRLRRTIALILLALLPLQAAASLLVPCPHHAAAHAGHAGTGQAHAMEEGDASEPAGVSQCVAFFAATLHQPPRSDSARLPVECGRAIVLPAHPGTPEHPYRPPRG